MKKETIVAVTFGIILGLVVAAVVVLQTKNKELAKVKLINNFVNSFLSHFYALSLSFSLGVMHRLIISCKSNLKPTKKFKLDKL